MADDSRQTKYRWGGALILWMGVIFLFSQQPGAGTDWVPPWWYIAERKGAHIVEYAVLMLVAYHFFRQVYQQEKIQWVVAVAFVLAVSYGFLDEIHQYFIFGRGSKVSDVGFDTLGALLMGALLLGYYRHRLFQPKV